MSKPVFTKKLGSAITINPGVPYSIECAADGQPRPVIVWTKDGVPLKQFNAIKYKYVVCIHLSYCIHYLLYMAVLSCSFVVEL